VASGNGVTNMEKNQLAKAAHISAALYLCEEAICVNQKASEGMLAGSASAENRRRRIGCNSRRNEINCSRIEL